MKIKHTMKVAMLSVLTTMGGGILFTSCEDMFTTDNGLVTDDLSPKDTVYTMMGIVKNMQRIMDRTVIFGELRADLVDVDDSHTPSDLRDIANHTVSTDNAYNDPRDFYNVINSCNIYLANVDTKRMASHSTDESYGEAYFEKEIIATKCYRAWTYLELAKIYGAQNIPFILEPVTTSDAAERMVADTSKRTNMIDLCTFFIDDIKSYADQQWNNEELQPDYSVTFKAGQESNVEISYRNFFIPVRLMLAELYLWRGSYTQNVNDYREAVRYYHEFLTHSNNNRNNVMPSYRVTWSNRSGVKYARTLTTYSNFFSLRGNVAVIPMDTTAYYGNTSSIREVFSSKYSNNYYPAAVPSQHVREIFHSQDYFYFDSISPSDVTREYAPKTEDQLRTNWEGRWWTVAGDLRFSSVYYSVDYNNSSNANYNNEWAFNMKWEGGVSGMLKNSTTDQRPEFMPLFRLPIVYLHMAEALNRAGFPESAFVILKYGISTSALQTYAASEFEALQAITAVTSEDGDFTQWNVNNFVTKDMVSYAEYQKGNFNQWPIHAMGCGETWYDDKYTTGVNIKDVKYAVGDETIVEILDDNGDVILDNDNNPDLTAAGTPVYNYGSWNLFVNKTGTYSSTPWQLLDKDPAASLAYSHKSVISGSTLVSSAYIEESIPVRYQALMSYDDYMDYLSKTFEETYPTWTDTELQALYDTYEDNYNVIQKAYKHNKALKTLSVADQQTSVAELILTEEAIEGMFEGTRWADLMRYSKQIGNDAFLGQTVAKRKGEGSPDGAIASKLASESGWYVTLPRR